MFKHLILAVVVAVSFGGSILASTAPASAYLRYTFSTVHVNTHSDDSEDDDDDDDFWPF